MAPQRKLLFITNSELGQSNIFLAVIQELLLSHAVSIYITSYPDLQPRIHELQAALLAAQRKNSNLTFRALSGLSMKEAFHSHGDAMSSIAHPPGLNGGVKAFRHVLEILMPWSRSEYHQSCLECADIIKDVDPDVIVLDSLLSQAMDACTLVGRRYCLLVPLGLNEVAKYADVNRWRYWTYPM